MIESSEARRTERRYQAGRPYYRPANKQRVSSHENHIYAVLITFIVGAMLGATLAMGWLA